MLTYLSAIVICAVIARGIIFVVQKARKNELVLGFDQAPWERYLACFASGVYSRMLCRILFMECQENIFRLRWDSIWGRDCLSTLPMCFGD